MKYLKGCILDLVESCNIFMAINTSKVFVEYLKGTILDLFECCLRFSNVFFISVVCSTSIFPCIIAMISKFMTFFYLSHIYFQFFLTNIIDF